MKRLSEKDLLRENKIRKFYPDFKFIRIREEKLMEAINGT